LWELRLSHSLRTARNLTVSNLPLPSRRRSRGRSLPSRILPSRSRRRRSSPIPRRRASATIRASTPATAELQKRSAEGKLAPDDIARLRQAIDEDIGDGGGNPSRRSHA
jgi:hypothetical protein